MIDYGVVINYSYQCLRGGEVACQSHPISKFGIL